MSKSVLNSTEVPGNVMASGALVQALLLKSGLALHQLNNYFEEQEGHDVLLKSIRLSFKYGASGDCLVVVSVDTQDGPRVGFHNATSMSEGLVGTWNRLRNGTMKWRVDEYAK